MLEKPGTKEGMRMIKRLARHLGRDFDGESYRRARDQKPMAQALARVFHALLAASERGEWLTIPELTDRVNDTGSPRVTENGVGARIRDLRKPKFGQFDVCVRCRPHRRWEYQLQIERDAGSEAA